ncbi:nitroreductase family protein [bacterium]|nr:nitroreductase family protein [candidate division CSSED10-310 bacterium]
MFETMTPAHSAALDAIIKARRTVREFNPDQLSRETVEAIIAAGLMAPFGALAVAGMHDFRKIFVIRRGSATMDALVDLIKKRIARQADELEKRAGQVPFVQILRRAGREGIPALATAPVFIVVGEKKGMPPVASLSLCYCLQNMWLKATSLGVGLQLVSVTMQMEDDPDFCALLDIPAGDYALDGCVLGYPADEYRPHAVEYPTLERAVRWL